MSEPGVVSTARSPASKRDWKKTGWIIAIEVAVIFTAASFFLPGGDDLYRFYLPFAKGCLDCGFVPYFARWVLWPMTLLPPYLVWPVWTVVSMAGFLGLSRYTGVNPAIVILSFPAMGQFWLGQIDIVVTAGLVIGLLAANPYLKGAGILLAMVKPQLAGFAVLIMLVDQPRRELVKVMAVPIAAMLLSFVVYGPAWPVDWLTNSLENLPTHVWRLASKDIWRYGLILIVSAFAFRPGRPRFEAVLMLSALATPFFGVYSYLIFLVFRAPWWSVLLSYAWVIMYPFAGNASMRYAWVLPVGLLVHLFVQEHRRGSTGFSRQVEREMV